MAYKDLEKRRAAGRAYYVAHVEKIKQVKRAYYLTHKEKEWAVRQRTRFDVLQYYSNGIPSCANCREQDLIVLTIDHINNDGAKLRKTQGTGTRFYRWLKRNNYPEGYQVLCWNCNARKELERQRMKIFQS